MLAYLYVALGGALGASARYAVSQFFLSSAFPLGTFLVNVFGSFVLGFVMSSAAKWNLSTQHFLFLTVGLMGAFTTFSTFSVELLHHLQSGQLQRALLYLLLSVSLGVLAAYLGFQLGR